MPNDMKPQAVTPLAVNPQTMKAAVYKGKGVITLEDRPGSSAAY